MQFNVIPMDNRKNIKMSILINIVVMMIVCISLGLGGGVKATAASYENIEDTYEEWDEELKDYVKDLCEENDIKESVVLGIIWNESRFQSDATGYNTNGTKDYGLMQLNDVTFDFLSEKIGIESMEDLYDAKTNILAGITILKYHKDYTDDENAALLRYQVGEGGYNKIVRGERAVSNAYYNVLEKAEEFENILNSRTIEEIENVIEEMKK